MKDEVPESNAAAQGGPGASSVDEWGERRFGKRISKVAESVKATWATLWKPTPYKKFKFDEMRPMAERFINELGVDGAVDMVLDPDSGLQNHERAAMAYVVFDRASKEAQTATDPDQKARANELALDMGHYLTETSTESAQRQAVQAWIVTQDPTMLLEKRIRERQDIVEDQAKQDTGMTAKEIADEVQRRVDEALREILARMDLNAQPVNGRPVPKPRTPEQKAQALADQLMRNLLDTVKAAKVPQPETLRWLVNEALRAEAMPADFQARVQGLGVSPKLAALLEKVTIQNREQMKLEARDRAADALMKSLLPKAKSNRARKILRPAVQKLADAAANGALDRDGFTQAYAESMGIKPFTPEVRARLADLASKARAAPEGMPRMEANLALANELALHDGIPARDALWSAWYSNLLSGGSTQAVNLKGNWDSLKDMTLATLIASPKDGLAMLDGMVRGAGKGVIDLISMLRGQTTWKRQDVINQSAAAELLAKIPWKDRTVAQKAATVIGAGPLSRFVFRAMGGVDILFYHTQAEGRATLAASRAARRDGHTPGTRAYWQAIAEELGLGEQTWKDAQSQAALEAKDLKKDGLWIKRRTWDIVNEGRKPEIREEADAYALDATYQNQPTGLAKDIGDLLEKFQNLPGGRFFVPFRQIIVNTLARNIQMSPIGIVQGIIGREIRGTKQPDGTRKVTRLEGLERKRRLALGVIGTLRAGMLMANWLQHKDEDDRETQDMIYGYGPTDKGERALMPKNWRPFTIKQGDKYISYVETPMGLFYAALGGYMDAVRYNNKWDDMETQDKFAYVWSNVMNVLMSQGPLSGARTMADTLGGEKSLPAALGRPLSGFVPGVGLLRDVSLVMDPTKMDATTVQGAMLQDVPVIRGMVNQPALNRWGENVEMGGLPVVRRFVTKQGNDPVNDWLASNKMKVPLFPRRIEAGQWLDGKERFAAKANRIEAKMLTEQEQRQFIKRAGPLAKEGLIKLMNQVEPMKQRGVPVSQEWLQQQVSSTLEAANRVAMRELTLR